MIWRKREALAPHTTLRVGGEARFFAECATEAELEEALVKARTEHVPVAILGGGANTLVPDSGFEGAVIQIGIQGVEFSGARVTAGAGVAWDALVDAAAARELWGIENLAGIPGTVGGAAVQNIGAYGAELAETFLYADAIDLRTGKPERISKREAELSYRMSIFKRRPELVITRVALALSETPRPKLSYPDLMKAGEASVPLATSREIATAVRAIRAKKFPDLSKEGTAGSFFKNPIVRKEEGEALAAKLPGLPLFEAGNSEVKIPLAWLLDKGLALRGFSKGKVRLFEVQPLVVVTQPGARAEEVDALAEEVRARVRAFAGITIEREVETLAPRT